MKDKQIKYSIIIPVHNGVKYLPTCVETIINQEYSNYELIISDDHSTDGTDLYLNDFLHPNVRIIYPEKRMSMVEHFEWSLNQAYGDWIIFVGADDGLQSYFFTLADQLTQIADKKKIRAIMSERAYFFWPGCESVYGKIAVSFNAIKSVRILNCKFQSLLTLLGFQTYFELPEMYTTSLFKRSLIEEAKQKQNGNLFCTIPPDANLGAIACSLEHKYLKSLIPLGWIGTSPETVVISMESVSNSKVNPNPKIEYHKLSGDFALRSCSIYYWNALLKTKTLRKRYINIILLSKIFRTFMFAGVLAEIKLSSKIDSKPRYDFFKIAVKLNRCNIFIVKTISYIFPVLYKFYGIKRSLHLKLLGKFIPTLKHNLFWDKESTINFINVSLKIKSELSILK